MEILAKYDALFPRDTSRKSVSRPGGGGLIWAFAASAVIAYMYNLLGGNKMKKLIAMLLALVMVLGLCACSVETAPAATEAPKAEAPAADAPAAEAPAAPAAEPVEISLWTFPVGEWGNEETVKGWTDAFTAKYPHITVNVEYLDYQSGDDKLNTAIEGGQAPDLIFEGPERLIATYADKGLLLDISELLGTDAGKQLYSSVVGTCSIDGKLYAYPVSQTAHVMAINRDMFEAAGAMEHINEETHTWKSVEDFFAAVQKVYDNGQKNVGAIYCGGQGGDQGTRHLISNIAGGTPWSNPEHTEFTVAVPENAEALAKLYAQDGINFDASIVGGDEINLFIQKQLAMATCWNITLHNNNKDAIDFNLLPLAFPCDNTPVLAGGFYCLGVFDNGDAARAEAAKLFIQWMTGNDEVYASAVKAAGQWPTRDMAGLYEGDALMTEYGIMAPMMGDYYQITKNWAPFRTEMWNALQRIAQGDGTAESILAELQTAQDNAHAFTE